MKIRKQKKKLAADQSDDDGSDTDLELEGLLLLGKVM